MLRYDTLMNYFKTNFTLIHQYHYNLAELENMIPWERDVYISMLSSKIEEENEKIKLQALGNR